MTFAKLKRTLQRASGLPVEAIRLVIQDTLLPDEGMLTDVTYGGDALLEMHVDERPIEYREASPPPPSHVQYVSPRALEGHRVFAVSGASAPSPLPTPAPTPTLGGQTSLAKECLSLGLCALRLLYFCVGVLRDCRAPPETDEPETAPPPSRWPGAGAGAPVADSHVAATPFSFTPTPISSPAVPLPPASVAAAVAASVIPAPPPLPAAATVSSPSVRTPSVDVSQRLNRRLMLRRVFMQLQSKPGDKGELISREQFHKALSSHEGIMSFLSGSSVLARVAVRVGVGAFCGSCGGASSWVCGRALKSDAAPVAACV
jgi:hypothetical protein